MQKTQTHIFKNALIFMMLILVCVPCSAKREFKELLDIPVAVAHHTLKPNITFGCHTFTQVNNSEHSVSSQKKNIQKTNTNFSITLYKTPRVENTIFQYSNSTFVAAVPIYIFHQQYRI